MASKYDTFVSLLAPSDWELAGGVALTLPCNGAQLGLPASQSKSHTLAHVHRMVANSLVEPGDDRELHREL
jgi:hypothetical protein